MDCITCNTVENKMNRGRMKKLAGINEGILQSNEIWRINELRHGYAILNSKGEYVVEPQDEEGRYGAIEDKEHAQLIAAAPEMYALLDDIIGEAAFEGLPDSKQDGIYAILKKVKTL